MNKLHVSQYWVGLATGALLALTLVWAMTTRPGAVTTAQAAAQAQDAVEETVAVSQVLHYQGRLLTPGTRTLKPDGSYSMSFQLYNVSTGGAPLWTESKSVAVSNGLFNTLLGDLAPLNSAVFNGQELYLGVTVGSDPETSPRQRLAHVAYAMRSEQAGNADTLDGQDSSAFALDSEVMPIVLASDGSGSGVDSDTVDGLDSSALYKGYIGTQISSNLASTGVHNWTTWGYSPDTLVVWWARPMTQGGQLKLEVETLLEGCCGAGQGLYTYFLRVTNTGSVATDYDLVRYTLYQ